jgi:predicted SAM-dependent methyltransferase
MNAVSLMTSMTNGRFSFKRKLTSYNKVQVFASAFIRSSPLFIRRRRIKDLRLLNVGCGSNTEAQFVNLDYQWSPQVDICWDITRKPYPIESASLEGIYTEHCLEHIGLTECERNLEEFYRMLKPGGNLRIVVPDGELYLDIYERRKKGESVLLPYENGYITPMARINGIFRDFGHQFIYDFATVKKLLEKTGFRDVKKESFRKGRDQRLLVDTEARAIESLYVEATK